MALRCFLKNWGSQRVTKPGRQQHPISNLMRQIKICFQLKEGFRAGSEVRTSWWAEALFVWSSLWRQSHRTPEGWWRCQSAETSQCPTSSQIQTAQCHPGLPGSGCADVGQHLVEGIKVGYPSPSSKGWDSLAAGLRSCTSWSWAPGIAMKMMQGIFRRKSRCLGLAVQITSTALAFENSSVQKCVFIAEIIQGGHSPLYEGQALWLCLASADPALWGPGWGRGDLGEQQEVRGWGKQEMSTVQRSGWGTPRVCWSVGSAAPGTASATPPQQFQGRGCWEKGWQVGFGTAWSFALVVCGSAILQWQHALLPTRRKYKSTWSEIPWIVLGQHLLAVQSHSRAQGAFQSPSFLLFLTSISVCYPQWLFICCIILYFI